MEQLYLLDHAKKLQPIGFSLSERVAIPGNYELPAIVYELARAVDGRPHAASLAIEVSLANRKTSYNASAYEFPLGRLMHPLKISAGATAYRHKVSLPAGHAVSTDLNGLLEDKVARDYISVCRPFGLSQTAQPVGREEAVKCILNYDAGLVKHYRGEVMGLVKFADSMKGRALPEAVEALHDAVDEYCYSHFVRNYCETAGLLVAVLGPRALGGLPAIHNTLVLQPVSDLGSYMAEQGNQLHENHCLTELLMPDKDGWHSIFIDPALKWTSTGILRPSRPTGISRDSRSFAIFGQELLPSGAEAVTVRLLDS